MQSAAGDPTGGVLGGSGNWWAGNVEITSPYPGSINTTSLAGSGTIALAANASTQWTATVQNQQTWIHIVSGTSGTGNGSVSYTYDANQTGSQRQGCIFVDDINDIANNGGALGGNVCINQSGGPAISGISPQSAPIGTAVAITGINFGSSQGTSTVTFNGVAAVPSAWGQASITVPVPVGASTGNIVVTVAGIASNGVLFTVPGPPSISSLNPASGAAGLAVTIAGIGFGATQGSSKVTFNGATAGTALNWSDTSIVVVIPSTATTGNVVVAVNGVNSSGAPFTLVTSPSIGTLSPASGQIGTTVKITGSNFGASQGSSTVTFNGIPATPTNWSTGSITVPVPTGATTGPVVVTVGGASSSGAFFAIPPILTNVSPTTAAAGMQVTLSGSGFGPTQGGGAVWLGTTYGTIVSWSDTQIVATVASNSKSGTARLLQAGAWSGTVPFTINTATISNVTPASGVPGTQVTITGTSFGAQQGGGQVWLGTAAGIVQSWSDTQVVAQVAAGSASGNAQILENGVASNAVPFSVNTPQITSISPTSGSAGTAVTISGSGFGSTQGAGTALVGSINGQVVSWSDTQVVAAVATGSLSGIVRVTQNGIQSNSKSFMVPGPGGSILTLTPDTLRMMVGDTHTIQALNSSSQPVIGLTWTSSDPTIVSLSTDDPPLLTAVAAGHVTITAGNASADVTVSSVAFAPGTVLWSNPVGGATVDYIVPAVPSPTGVADVFALSGSTVYAITSDGATAWTADLSDFSCPYLASDFQGGLVVAESCAPSAPSKIVKLDGITGQRYPAYTPDDPSCIVPGDPVIHPDGTIFALRWQCVDGPETVIGIDPTSGTVKFQVPLPKVPGGFPSTDDNDLIIAGDGFAYVTYGAGWFGIGDGVITDPTYNYGRFGVLRVSSSGASQDFPLRDWYTTNYFDPTCYCHPTARYGYTGPSMITNADTGVLISWYEWTGADWAPFVANVTGTGVSIASGPQVPRNSTFPSISLQLQAQDGSFIGLAKDDAWTPYAFSFDAGGNVHWVVPNVWPAIATADGGFIGQDTTSNQFLAFDQNGNATGHMSGTFAYSWFGNSYQIGSVDQILPSLIIDLADTFWVFFQGNAAGTRTANRPLAKTVQQLVSQVALGYVGSQNWVGHGVACNLFVKQVLQDTGQKVPYSTNWVRRVADIFGLLNSPLYYPALAGDWASRTNVLGCWHNVTVPSNRAGGYPADLSRAGDVIAEAINYSDATGHVGIVVGWKQTVSADSAAACMSGGTVPAETIDITDYGFRPDGWASSQTYSNGVPCSTSGWKSNAVVKRFTCQ